MFKSVKNWTFRFMLFAVSGWVYEVLLFFKHGKGWINRGFLYGPYLPIYGFGGILLVFLLGKLMKKKIKLGINITPLIVLVLIFIITSIVEYVAHFAMDKAFNIILWDYTKDAWNIHGRVCFKASRNFAVGGMIALYALLPIFERLLKPLKEKTKNYLFVIIVGILIIDFFITILF